MNHLLQKLLFLVGVIVLAAGLAGFTPKDNSDDVRPVFFFGQGLSILEQQRNQFIRHDGLTARTVTINGGETLAQKLDDAGLDPDSRQKIIEKLGTVLPLSQIRSGQEIIVIENETDDKLQLIALHIPTGVQHYWLLEARDNFRPQKKQKQFARKIKHVDGIINKTFYETSQEFDIPFPIFLQYIRLMSFDVSFQQDIRPGTEFSILYEELYDNAGKRVDHGDMLIAGLKLPDNREFTYYLYETANGVADYYAKDGRSARKLLMKTPLDGSRISSTFGQRRHPILGYSRAHKGLDFAAAKGTPIYAAGAGKIIKRGYNQGGYGRYLIIEHDNHYSTLYAHLDSFARKSRRGSVVEQQQIIGYVGSTGLSTGPHLHYEIRKNNKQINPLQVKFKNTVRLTGDEYQRLLQASIYLDNIADFTDKTEFANLSLVDWLRYRRDIAAVKSKRF